MRILSLDLSKFKTVACDYEAETGRHQFATVLTTHNAALPNRVLRQSRRKNSEQLARSFFWAYVQVSTYRELRRTAHCHVRGKRFEPAG
jgi:hypothetical protein